MTLLRAIAVAAAIFVLAPPPPASAQISPNASWSCEFVNSPTDCGFNLQAFASSRATTVSPGRDGTTAAELTTQPGDSNLYGSGTAERADMDIGISTSYCNQGQDEWWAHSLMFPQNYVIPPAGSVWNWGVVFDFHHTGPTGQPNFQIASLPTGLEFWVSGGPTVVNGPTDPGFHSVAIGPVTKNVWYDFMYHVKWSSGSDGFFQAWLNGQQLMNYSGATLYVGESCYLKLANYHTPLGVPISVIHSRVVRGATQADVQLPSSPGPKVAVPNVVGQTQAAAASALTGAGLTVGAVTMQSSSTVAAGSVISESPPAGTEVASGSPVNLVVSSGPAQIAVPNVVGQTQAAATSAITGAGLTVGAVTMQSSSTVASGSVISESPPAGTKVASGSPVNLVVSSGPAQIAVPNVVGQTQAAAASAITGAGLTVGAVTMQSSSTVAAGSVISESPPAGTKVASGSAVNLVVSTGSTGTSQVAVPDVVGQTQAAAASAITGAGLTVGAVTMQSSSTVAAGSVISESPSAGTKVASGSAVDLVVSSGPAQVAVPNVVGQTQAAAASA